MAQSYIEDTKSLLLNNILSSRSLLIELFLNASGLQREHIQPVEIIIFSNAIAI